MQITIISTGMDGRRTLTAEAAEAIAESDLLIGAERMLQPYADTGKAIFCSFHPEAIAARLHAGTERRAAVLVSGDCSFYSIAGQLRNLLKDENIRQIAGISSPAYFCAKMGISAEHMQYISLHGTENAIAIHVRQHPFCCFLLGGKITAAAFCQRLCDYHMAECRVHLMENAGYPEEKFFSGKAADFLQHPAESLCTIITENPSPTDSCHLPDTAFRRTEIPMTKEEIRCLAVTALQITDSSVCWDIGCGTGSVAVEMALHCPKGKVYAIDRNPAAVQLTAENARRHNCDHLLPVEEDFPAEISLPAPDRVSSGEVWAECRKYLRKSTGKIPMPALQ